MKKILLLALTLVLSATLVGILSLKETSFIADEGYISTNDDVLNLILRDDVNLNNMNDRKASLTYIEEMSSIYQTINGTFVTSDKLPLNESIPMYLTSGQVVRFFNDKSVLVETNFNTITTYDGLYLSKGNSFNSGGDLADLEEFIVAALPNGLFLNSQNAKVITNDKVDKISINSLLNLTLNRINYLEFVNGILVYNTILADETTTIEIGKNTYNYYRFVKNLNDIQDQLNIPRPMRPEYEIEDRLLPFDVEEEVSEDKFDIKDKEEILDLDDTLVPSVAELDREDEGGSIDSLEAAEGENSENADVEPARPYVIFDGKVDNGVYFAKTSIIINDKFGLIKGGVKFVVKDEQGQLYLRKSVYESGDILLEVLKPDSKYSLEVMYTYKNEKGDTETVLVTPNGIPFETKSRKELEQVDIDYLKSPVIKDDLDPLYYPNKATINEIYFPAANIDTGDTSENVINHNVKHEISFTPEGKLSQKSVINYINRIEANFYVQKNGQDIDKGIPFKLSNVQITDLKKGKKIDYTTPEDLTYSTYFRYDFTLYDQFGGVIETTPQESGYTHTCKTPPFVDMKLESYKIRDVILKLGLKNPSNVDLSNIYFVVVQDDNQEVTIPLEGFLGTDINKEDSRTSLSDLAYEGVLNAIKLDDLVDSKELRLKFTNLDFGVAYRIKAYASFDLENGLGKMNDVLILDNKFITADINDAGKAIFDYLDIVPGTTGVKYYLKYNVSTSDSLINLIDEIDFTINKVDEEINLPKFEFKKSIYGDKTTFNRDLITDLNNKGYSSYPIAVIEDEANTEGGKNNAYINVNLVFDSTLADYYDSAWDLFKVSNKNNVYLEFEWINYLDYKTEYEIIADSIIYSPTRNHHVTEVQIEKPNVFKTLKRDAKSNFDPNKKFVTGTYVDFLFDPEVNMIDDPDGSVIGGEREGVSIAVYPSKPNPDFPTDPSKVIKSDNPLSIGHISTNVHQDSYRISNLDPNNNKYFVEIYANYYNIGYNELENDIHMIHEFTFELTDAVKSEIKLIDVTRNFKNGDSLDEINLLHNVVEKSEYEDPNNEIDKEKTGYYELNRYVNTASGTNLVISDNKTNLSYFVVPVEPGSQYTLFNNIILIEWSWVDYSGLTFFQRTDGTWYRPQGQYTRTSSTTFDIPDDVNKVAINISNKALATAVLMKVEEEGLPYYTEDLIKDKTFEDIVDLSTKDHYMHFSTTNLNEYEGYYVSNYFEVEENALYRIDNNGRNNGYVNYTNPYESGVYFYDKSNEIIGMISINSSLDSNWSYFMTPIGTKYIRFNVFDYRDESDYEPVRLEKYLSSSKDSVATMEVTFEYTGKNEDFDEQFKHELILTETSKVRGSDDVITEEKVLGEVMVDGKKKSKFIYNTDIDNNKDYQYKVSIRMLNDKLIDLDDLDFAGGELIESINNEFELQRILYNPRGTYVVNSDMVIDNHDFALASFPSANQSHGQFVFDGHLDFNGHTLTMVCNEDGPNNYNYLINAVGSHGLIENINYVFKSRNYDSGAFVNANQGTLRNIRVTLNTKDAIKESRDINSHYGICTNNFATGIIENFVVRVESYISGYNTALVVGDNRGIIRNGAVYGAVTKNDNGEFTRANLDILAYDLNGNYFRNKEETNPANYISTVVRNNIGAALIDNVYSAIDIVIDEPLLSKPETQNRGIKTFDTTGTATITNSFSVGSVRIRSLVGTDPISSKPIYKIENTSDLYGPFASTHKMENNYWYTDDSFAYEGGKSRLDKSKYIESSITTPFYSSNNTLYNELHLVSPDSLYDYSWYTQVLSNEFDIQHNVNQGNFPTINLGPKMAKYQFKDLTPIEGYVTKKQVDSNDIIFKSSSVIKQNKDDATLRLVFQNPNNIEINKIEIEHLNTEIISQEKFFEDYVVIAKVTVNDIDPKYRSRYRIKKVIGNVITDYDDMKYNFYVYPKFYQEINTANEFLSITSDKFANKTGLFPDLLENNSSVIIGNYRIASDLDFSDEDIRYTDGRQIVFNDYNMHIGSNKRLFGDLDGGIYEVVEETLEDGTIVKNEVMTGMHKIKNINLDGDYPSFIRYSDGKISNLIFENFSNVNARNKTLDAGVIGEARYKSIIDNVHVVNSTVQGAYNVGGLVGRLNYAIVMNSSVTSDGFGNKTVVSGIYNPNTSDSCIGGLIGYSYLGQVYNSYSNNVQVENLGVNTILGTGGLIGRVHQGGVINCYTNNDISSVSINTGGIVGMINAETKIENCFSTSRIFSNSYNVGGIFGTEVDGRIGMPIYNNLALGNLNSRISDCEDINPIIGRLAQDHVYTTASMQQQNFAYEGLYIDGKKLNDARFGGKKIDDIEVYESLEIAGVNKILSYEDLGNVSTYVDVMNFGDSYDYNGGHQVPGRNGVLSPSIKIKGGTAVYLPMLLDTRGNVLYGQEPIKLEDDYAVINSAKANLDSPSYDVTDLQIVVDLPKGLGDARNLDFYDIEIEGLEIGSMDYLASGNTLEIKVNYANFTRYYDSYILRFKTNIADVVHSYSLFFKFAEHGDAKIYKAINNIDEWNNYFKDNKAYYDNIWITGDIDFSQGIDNVYGIRVNNIKVGDGSETKTIKNVEVSPTEKSFGIFEEVNGSIENLVFDNIHISLDGNRNYKNVGVISKLFGDMKNVTFKNITIDNIIDENGKDKNTFVYETIGSVGRSYGNITDTTLQNIQINFKKNSRDTDSHRICEVGFLVGKAERSCRIYNCLVLAPDVPSVSHNTFTSTVTNTYNIGGLTGVSTATTYSRMFDGCEIRNVKISGARHVGGVAGTISRYGNNVTYGDILIENISIIDATEAEGRSNYGAFAGNCNFDDSKENGNIIINNISIISYGKYVGGVIGTGSYIENVTLTNAAIAGGCNVSGIGVGHILNANIDRIYVTHLDNSIYSDAQEKTPFRAVGGFYSQSAGHFVRDSKISRSVIGYDSDVHQKAFGNGASTYVGEKIENTGGVIGRGMNNINNFASAARVTVSDVKVNGTNGVGGIGGYGTTVDQCVVMNSMINGTNGVGGIVGIQKIVDVFGSSVYNDVIIEGEQNVGGLIGLVDISDRDYYDNEVRVINNISGGKVKGKDNIAGIIGLYIDDDGKFEYTVGKTTYQEFQGNIVACDIIPTDVDCTYSVLLNLSSANSPTNIEAYLNVNKTIIHEYTRIGGNYAKNDEPLKIALDELGLNEAPKGLAYPEILSAEKFLLSNKINQYNKFSIDRNRFNFDHTYLLKDITEEDIININSNLALSVDGNKVSEYTAFTENKEYKLSSDSNLTWYRTTSPNYDDKSKVKLAENKKEVVVAGAGYYFGEGLNNKTIMIKVDIPTYLPFVADTRFMPREPLDGAFGYYNDKVNGYFYPVSGENIYNGVRNYTSREAINNTGLYSTSYATTRGIKEELEFTVYPSSVKTINIEINNVSSLPTEVKIIYNDQTYDIDFDSRVVTLNYDFNDDFTLTYKYNGKIHHKKFYKDDLVRTIDTFGNSYYYLNDHRASNQDGEFGSGMIHLFNNEVLKKDGYIYNIDSCEVVDQIKAIELFKKVRLIPLYEGSYEGIEIATFKNFSIADDTLIESPMIVKNNEIYGLLTSDVAKSGFIIDGEIIYYLEQDGNLTKFGTKDIKVPKNLKLSGIKEISDNFDNTNSLVLIRYENDVVVGFNYLTGERIDFKISEPQISLKEFAKSNSNKTSQSNLATKYAKTTNIYENLKSSEALENEVSKLINDMEENENLNLLNPQAKLDISGSSESKKSPTTEKEELQTEAQKALSEKNKDKLNLVTLYNKETKEFELHETTVLLGNDSKSIDVKSIVESLEIQKMIPKAPSIGERLVATISPKKNQGLAVTLVSILLVLTASAYLFVRRNK